MGGLQEESEARQGKGKGKARERKNPSEGEAEQRNRETPAVGFFLLSRLPFPSLSFLSLRYAYLTTNNCWALSEGKGKTGPITSKSRSQRFQHWMKDLKPLCLGGRLLDVIVGLFVVSL